MKIIQWCHRFVLLFLIFAIGIGLSFYTYQNRTKTLQDTARAHFIEQALVQGMRAQQLIDEAIQTLDAFDAYFTQSGMISRTEYRNFAKRLLPSRQEIFAIHWTPVVFDHERYAFEKELIKEGLAPAGFFDVVPKADKQFPSPKRKSYLPIIYAEPLEPNHQVVGLDVSARPYNESTRVMSAQSGVQITTTAFPIMQDPHGPLAVAIYQPVYKHGSETLTPKEREASLRGYLILMLRPEILLTQRLGVSQGAKLAMRLIDNKNNSAVIYPRTPDKNIADGLIYRFPLKVPGREWILELRSDLPLETDVTLKLLLGCMLVLTAMTGLFVDRGRMQMLKLKWANESLEKQHVELEKIALFDPLTGLANRSHLQVLTERLLYSEKHQYSQIAICMLDLDNFKQVNDKLGHDVGDQLLQEVARIMTHTLRKSDVTARLGGDEFVFVLSMPRRYDDLIAIIDRILKQIAASSTRLTKGQVSVSASIGIAISNSDCQSFTELLKRADIAMYQAKGLGKNGYKLWPE